MSSLARSRPFDRPRNSYGLGFAEFLRVLGLVGDLADSEPGAEIPAEQGYSIGGIMRYMEIAGGLAK